MGVLSDEEKKMINQTIRDRIAGKVDDPTWNTFLKMLAQFQPPSRRPIIPDQKKECYRDRIIADKD